ncbi:hypothetical protein ACVW0Q_000976 [Thermostichus sp. MS-CIW-21]|nr:hypothetical protein CYA_0284 [Synechococcus sp. JA-3-3Ab]PIK87413.1 hypothetical protein SYN63AY4M2_05875 [Synechococcus sp. 63AY4M2]PIK89796.1 hypothetical protein SYN65AY6A5_09705 [Synechococcus sp. 65AY6A5]PIK93121.1 hypothetical protein SYN65AY6LI_03270 [Synechococcus sp. 65AY6Li]PIK96430.1 hypothetical protein SYN60AY4M2_06450 [Synechococcus sp. 60AY4M2]PIK99027.1 hypothetical protein SYN63AY4M1_03900 [Synechococcus sp. 63AY4M1]PIL02525.1 hypothetical protein SYN65AY640_10200 [Synech
MGWAADPALRALLQQTVAGPMAIANPMLFPPPRDPLP